MPEAGRELAVDKDKYKELSKKYKRKIIFATNVRRIVDYNRWNCLCNR